MWWVVVGGRMSPHGPTITLTPITTRPCGELWQLLKWHKTYSLKKHKSITKPSHGPYVNVRDPWFNRTKPTRKKVGATFRGRSPNYVNEEMPWIRCKTVTEPRKVVQKKGSLNKTNLKPNRWVSLRVHRETTTKVWVPSWKNLKGTSDPTITRTDQCITK